MIALHSKLLLAGVALAAMSLPVSAYCQQAAANPPEQQTANGGRSASEIEVLPASQLVNHPLIDSQGRDAGQIQGVIINTGNGAVDFVVVAGNSNFNLNGELIAVPWSALVPPMTTNGPITVKVAADKLAQAPRLNANRLNALEQPPTRADLYGFYGYPYWSGYYGGYTDRVPPAAVAPRYGAAPGWGMPGPYAAGPANRYTQPNPPSPTGNQLVNNGLVVSPDGVISELESAETSSTKTMRSAPVFANNPGGNAIGHIKRVLIDPERGEVAFVLIEQGGFLGLAPRWYAVPVEAFDWAPYQGGYRLTVNANLLSGEPAVQPHQINGPIYVPAAQLVQLYQNFGIRPYWEQISAQGSNSSYPDEAARANSGSPQVR